MLLNRNATEVGTSLLHRNLHVKRIKNCKYRFSFHCIRLGTLFYFFFFLCVFCLSILLFPENFEIAFIPLYPPVKDTNLE